MIVCVTGATSGFGKACAIKFAQHSYNLIITGRRKDLLLHLAKEIQETYNVQVLPLVFDVQDKDAVNNAVASIPAEFKPVDVLVNNAGLALGRDHFEHASITDWETMIDTNVKGLLYVTKAFLPQMIAQQKGHIINIGSVAAKDAYEYGNTYCATKAAVDMLSKTMRIDLLKHQIKVTAIHPGAADTEFSTVRYKGDKQKADATYSGFTPLYANDVADVIFYTATLPKHVCINDLVVCCTAQANGIYIHKNTQ